MKAENGNIVVSRLEDLEKNVSDVFHNINNGLGALGSYAESMTYPINTANSDLGGEWSTISDSYNEAQNLSVRISTVIQDKLYGYIEKTRANEQQTEGETKKRSTTLDNINQDMASGNTGNTTETSTYPNRPVGRERHVTGQGTGLGRSGEGLGTGPVGSGHGPVN